MKEKNEILRAGDKVGDSWRIVEKLGEGGCGVVFLVKNIKNKKDLAMKIEMLNIRRNDQLLKNEAMILEKLKFSRYVPFFYYYGRTPKFRLLVMERLGKSLNDIRYSVPDRRLSTSDVLRVGYESLLAIRDVHRICFIHRDIKPTNFALGMQPNHACVYLFDFGLARSLLDPKEKRRCLRKERTFVAFRGTVAYCSPNVHKGKEHGRHDDLWSMMYMCIELIVGKLPWSRMHRKKAFFFKEFISYKTLLQGCPKKFALILNYLRDLKYNNHPDYEAIQRVFVSCIKSRNISLNGPFDWEEFSIPDSVRQKKSASTMKSSASSTPTLLTPFTYPDDENIDTDYFNTLTFPELQCIFSKTAMSSRKTIRTARKIVSLASLHSIIEEKTLLLLDGSEKECCL